MSTGLPPELEETIKDWSIELPPSTKTQIRIVNSYNGFIRDRLGVDGFLQHLSTCSLYTHAVGWVAFELPTPGASVEFHGAKWPGVEDDIIEPVSRLLEVAKEFWKLNAIIARVPVHAEGAVKFVEDLGFKRTGFIPYEDLYDSNPKHLLLYARYKEEDQ